MLSKPALIAFSIVFWVGLLGVLPVPTGAVALHRGVPFSATAATLLEAAAECPSAGPDGCIVLRQVTVSFDASGRRTWQRWQITLLASERAAKAAASAEIPWQPWYQERPQLRVRVVSPEGTERSVEAPPAPAAGGTSAERALEMPLPALVPGSVIEEEITLRDLRPFSAAGVAGSETMADELPIARARLVLEAPLSLPLRYGTRLLPGLVPGRTVEGGRVRVVFEAENLAALEPLEPGMPPSRPRRPQVDWSTGASWQEVATAYSRRVDERLAEVQAEIAGASEPRGAEPATERLARELALLHAGVLPAEAVIQPSDLGPGSLGAALARKAANAEELAALLVGRLRAAGIPAFVALVAAGFGKDVDPNLPGFGPFNHALVYVPAPSPLWIDPSDPYLRVGELPVEAQGRLALVAGTTTRELVRTPAAESFDNRTQIEVEVFLAEAGPGRIVETSEWAGSPERTWRRLMAQLGENDRRRAFESYVRKAYRAEELGQVEVGDPARLDHRFRLRIEAKKAGRAQTEGNEAAVAIPLQELVGLLPAVVLAPLDQPRQSDFLFHEPFVAEWHYRIVPPAGFVARPLPPSETRALGSARLEQQLEIVGGAVAASFRLDSGPRLLSPAQLDALRREVQGFMSEETLVVWFEREGAAQRAP